MTLKPETKKGPSQGRPSVCSGAQRRDALLGCRHVVLHAVVLFGALGVVEAVERAYQVAGDAADALEGLVVGVLGAAALGADVLDDAVVAAHRITFTEP